MRVMNFNAGPATLPLPALERARDEMLDFAGSGMSVMEHSHRGKEYEAVHHEAGALLRELLAVPATYDVLFLQGGASMQFAQIPMSFLGKGQTAEYVVNGTWGEKAVAEAKVTGALLGGEAHVAATTGTGDGKEKSYARANTPQELAYAAGKTAYLHYATNETIHGIQYGTHADVPLLTAPAGVPLVCDMSSDFLWRPMDISPYSFIYAGAQKNIGPSGVIVVLAQKDFVAQGRKDIPKIFQYRTAAENDSLYNTPPTFGIYLMRNVLAWVKGLGGLPAIEKLNRAKAGALYGAIDAHAGFYRGPVETSSRSVMNVVFRLPTEALEEKFVADAKKQKMVGLKGHRSVGGIRVSLYNAVSLEWATALADFMKQFAKENG